MNSFYNLYELSGLGFKSFGKNVLISRKCSIYGAENISFGDNVRIDDFVILSGSIEVGCYVHLAASVKLYARAGLKLGNFCGISANSVIYTIADDFSGNAMISPMVPDELTNVSRGKVVLGDFCQLGANTIIMPNITVREGAVTGAFSLVLNDLQEWSINFGVPCRYIKDRIRKVADLSQGLL